MTSRDPAGGGGRQLQRTKEVMGNRAANTAIDVYDSPETPSAATAAMTPATVATTTSFLPTASTTCSSLATNAMIDSDTRQQTNKVTSPLAGPPPTATSGARTTNSQQS